MKTKWTLGSNAVFDESYIDNFRQTGLREFIRTLNQSSRGGARVNVEVEIKPNAQTQTVDVVISFR